LSDLAPTFSSPLPPAVEAAQLSEETVQSSSTSPRRATFRRIRKKPSYILLKIRKPARILKAVLNKNIVRGLWTIYLLEGQCEGIVDFVPFGGTS